MGTSKMRTFCPHCYSIVPAGQRCRCRSLEAGDAARGEREPWRKEYGSADYQRNRQAAIGRQRGRCKDCGRVCASFDGLRWNTAGMGGEVDHEKPLREGGTNDAANLALRCRSCHRKAEAKRRKLRARPSRQA